MMVIEELEDEEQYLEIELRAEGLNCRCPVNGLMDTFSVELSYVPMRGRVLELGAFRALLEGYKDQPISHEALTLDVRAVIVEQIQPARLRLETHWAAVEGVACTVVAV